ncbi:hypothetical protein [Actinokineospora sp. NPDC004072]
MTIDGISRTLVWTLTLRRTARGGLTLHSGNYVSDYGFPVPSCIASGALELLDADLIRPGADTHGWHQRRLHLTPSGQDALMALIQLHPRVKLDPPQAVAERIITGLRNLPRSL